jgi:prolyl-tRNA synthetase
MINIYGDLINNYLMIPGIIGKKTESEKFAGAITSYTIESIMQDGQALQCGTSHYFGDKFSKVYNVQFSNTKNEKEYTYNTSWGVSTRLIGALIMCHSDDKGLVLPFKIAKTQINIIPILNKNSLQKENIEEYCKELLQQLIEIGYAAKIDNSEKGMGFKISESEIVGSPFCIIVGEKEFLKSSVQIKSRIEEEKKEIKHSEIISFLKKESEKFDMTLYDKAKERNNEKIRFAST